MCVLCVGHNNNSCDAVSVCVAANCSNIPKHGTILHRFPRYDRPLILKKWVKFVLDKRVNFVSRSTPSSRLCSDHFVVDDFVNKVKYEYGYAPRLDLHQTTVPSVHKQPPEIQKQPPVPPREFCL